MRFLTSAFAIRPSHRRGALLFGAALAAAAAMGGGTTPDARAACPWIVQPYAQTVPVTSEAPAFDIVFDGLGEGSKVFYGFTVASLDLAWQLANERALPALTPDGRRLEPKITPHGTVAYQLAPDTIQPQTIYLVAANAVIDELEALGARIEPARPMALSQLMPKTRGGTDWSGPLPHRSVPGFEIAGTAEPSSTSLAEIQICAYQVAMR